MIFVSESSEVEVEGSVRLEVRSACNFNLQHPCQSDRVIMGIIVLETASLQ